MALIKKKIAVCSANDTAPPSDFGARCFSTPNLHPPAPLPYSAPGVRPPPAVYAAPHYGEFKWNIDLVEI